MPLHKEPKEAIIYPASKKKPLPFKPHRPAKLARTLTEESSSSSTLRTQPLGQLDEHHVTRPDNGLLPAAQVTRAASVVAEDVDMSDIEQASNSGSDDLPDDPLQATHLKTRRNGPAQASDDTIGDQDEATDEQALLPEMHQTEVSQALLLRLMHEHFQSKDTRIDKHAIKVFQSYVDVFLRESVARAALSQKAEVDAGTASQSDRGWLDKKDLEKIAGGIILDF